MNQFNSVNQWSINRRLEWIKSIWICKWAPPPRDALQKILIHNFPISIGKIQRDGRRWIDMQMRLTGSFAYCHGNLNWAIRNPFKRIPTGTILNSEDHLEESLRIRARFLGIWRIPNICSISTNPEKNLSNVSSIILFEGLQNQRIPKNPKESQEILKNHVDNPSRIPKNPSGIC